MTALVLLPDFSLVRWRYTSPLPSRSIVTPAVVSKASSSGLSFEPMLMEQPGSMMKPFSPAAEERVAPKMSTDAVAGMMGISPAARAVLVSRLSGSEKMLGPPTAVTAALVIVAVSLVVTADSQNGSPAESAVIVT
ncbi:MAG: hypothetical protein ACYS5V_06940 [Planctomycetota bacterium]